MPDLHPRPARGNRRSPELRARLERPFNIAMTVAALATVPVLIAQERGDERLWVVVSDWAIWVVFFVEYTVMGWLAEDRRRYALRSWLSLSIVVLSFPLLPDLLAMTRMVRVARLMRLARLFRTVAVTVRAIGALRKTSGARGVAFVGMATAILTLGAGALLALLEPEAAPGGFWEGLWWAVVTVSTVGYGDIAPSSTGGRLLAVVLMLCGLGMVSTLAAAISSWLVGADEGAEFQRIDARLDRIERRLEEIAAAARAGSAGWRPEAAEVKRKDE